VGNKGYRKYLKLDRETVAVNQEKIEEETRYDGKWVLKTNTTLTAEQVALKYKELWQVEQVFRDMKSVLDTRGGNDNRCMVEIMWHRRETKRKRRTQTSAYSVGRN